MTSINAKELYKHAEKVIAGGTQLLSKNPKVYASEHPIYYDSAHGCVIKSHDGKLYRDFCYMGIGACVLGYADPVVNSTVIGAIAKGNMTTLNDPDEVTLADMLLQDHAWAGKVRYTRSGGEAMAVAIRIARSYTRRTKVMVCGYHGWHDWYLAANLENINNLDNHLRKNLNPGGVPVELTGSCIPYTFNDAEGFRKLFVQHQHELAAVVLEPMRYDKPTHEFLSAVTSMTKNCGIPLIFDEITGCGRTNPYGVHQIMGTEYYELFTPEPDMVVYAKAISNGYPFGAVIGKTGIMSAVDKTFISSTYWTESVGTAACIATIKQLKTKNYHELYHNLVEVYRIIKAASETHGVRVALQCGVILNYDFENSVMKEKYVKNMLERGFLVNNGYYPSFAHSDTDMKDYEKATYETFKAIK